MAPPSVTDTVAAPAAAEAETTPEQLAEKFYNATITAFERITYELWIVRVHADSGPMSFVPGQYASLGLGFWEPRIDSAIEADVATRLTKLVRRSYSISSPIFDGDPSDPTTPLAGCTDQDELELYVVLVEPEGDFVPGLTPRLALKDVGDRLFLGRKMAGRYTTAGVTDPATTMVFLSTGTGEAPQNAMITELLSKGHTGPIVSVLTSRQQVDFAYLAKNQALEARFPNFRYLTLPTREPGVPKRYLQAVIQEDFTRERLGVELDPTNTHVFICGNPAMIGLPEEVDGRTVFPHPTGVVELLVERGFTLDLRKRPGNIHVEEYW